MSYNLRLPNINGKTEREQLQQMQSYMYQLVEQLQFALNTINSSSGNTSSPAPSVPPVRIIQTPPMATMSLDRGLSEDQATFQAIKPLIIKSADIINAYYEEINTRLESIYVAQSDFGTFAEKTSQDIKATSTDTTQKFENIQVVITDLDSDLGSIESELLNISEEFSYTQRDIVTINSNIETIESNVDNLGGSISELDDEVKGVEETVGAIDSELKTVEANVGAVDTELQGVKSGVKSDINDLASEVDKVDTDLKDFKDNTDTNIQGINEDLQTVGDSVEGIDTDLQGFKNDATNDLQNIKDEIEEIKYIIVDVNSYIKSGLLYSDDSGLPVYGLEIGQRNTINGVEVFNKYARFTSDRLSFYDQNDTEVAYISDKKLYIANVEVLTSYKIGGLKETVLANGDVVVKWVGGEE